jgi:hypothetical protein
LCSTDRPLREGNKQQRAGECQGQIANRFFHLYPTFTNPVLDALKPIRLQDLRSCRGAAWARPGGFSRTIANCTITTPRSDLCCLAGLNTVPYKAFCSF